MRITTERLELLPMTAAQLKLWAENIPALEKELMIQYRGEPVEDWFLDIVRKQLEETESDPENFMWHSFWLIIRSSDRVAVGSADFKAPPDKDGAVEIGYGLSPEFEHNGYMTETAKAMCRWALEQKGVTSVIAETETDGYASQRILKRCGFCEEKRGKTVWWRLKP